METQEPGLIPRLSRWSCLLVVPALGLMIASLYLPGWKSVQTPLICATVILGGACMLFTLGVEPLRKRDTAFFGRVQAFVYAVLGGATLLIGVGMSLVLLFSKGGK